jgi:murein DD-endopeptidase MepM/ murein hydrolase activator NlpD
MTQGQDFEQSTPTPALTRRELRERERAAEGNSVLAGPSAAASQAAPQASTSTFVPSAPAAATSPFPFHPPAASAPPKRPHTPAAGIASRQSSVAPRRIARTVGSRLLSLGALVLAGALAFGMSVPANAFYAPSSALAEDSGGGGVATKSLQSVEVASNVQGASTERDNWSVLSWAEVLKERYGTRDYNYTVGMGPVRWPFPFAVEISSGFGDRVAPCRGCSSHHMGVDFNPGNGAAIFSIADGVVIEHSDDAYGYGNHVIIQHSIDGHIVTSLYAHMQHGTSPLNVGDVVKVGDFIGLVGQTGTATGPHLHLEITLDGVKVDPFAFLKSRAS